MFKILIIAFLFATNVFAQSLELEKTVQEDLKLIDLEDKEPDAGEPEPFKIPKDLAKLLKEVPKINPNSPYLGQTIVSANVGLIAPAPAPYVQQVYAVKRQPSLHQLHKAKRQGRRFAKGRQILIKPY